MNKITESNFNREVFIRAIEKLCMQNCPDDEYMDISSLVSSHIDIRFNPIWHWKFKPIYTFKIENGCMGVEPHDFTHKPIFHRNGYCLDYIPVKVTLGRSNITEGYELWLLDNMSLAVTYCCNISVRLGEYSDTASYRYYIKDGLYKIGEDFDVETFLHGIREQVLTAVYGEEGECIDDEENECDNCPNKTDCPFIDEV